MFSTENETNNVLSDPLIPALFSESFRSSRKPCMRHRGVRLWHIPHRETSYVSGGCGTTRWTTDLSLKVNLHHVINFKALWGTNLVTFLPEIWGNETSVVHRLVSTLKQLAPSVDFNQGRCPPKNSLHPRNDASGFSAIQGYLAHKKQPPP